MEKTAGILTNGRFLHRLMALGIRVSQRIYAVRHE